MLVAAAIEPAIEDDVGEIRALAMAESHQHECKVIGNVDAGDHLAEIDAVEQDRLFIDETDIAKMEIAVTLPDETIAATLLDQAGMADILRIERLGKCLDRMSVQRRF